MKLEISYTTSNATTTSTATATTSSAAASASAATAFAVTHWKENRQQTQGDNDCVEA